MDVSILLSTYDRAHQLVQTLQGFTALRTPGLDFEIIVVDNDTRGSVRKVAAPFLDRLPLHCMEEPARGKNRALNTAVELARGELLVFTDDDVEVQPDWLLELHQGAMRHPEASLFGGRILPLFPPGHEAWTAQLDFDHWFIRSAYVMADRGPEQEPIDPGWIWGPNMMVRRQVFDQGHRFDAGYGPNGSDYVMGGETEFLRRVAAAGHRCVYLPQAVVRHRIEPRQLSEEWLRARAFRMGRGHAAAASSRGMPTLVGIPRYLWREYLLCLGRRLLPGRTWGGRRFVSELEFEILKGKIHQFRLDRTKGVASNAGQ